MKKGNSKCKTAMWRKLWILALTILLTVGGAVISQGLQAAAASDEDYREIYSYVAKDEDGSFGRVKIGDYYYWIEQKTNYKSVKKYTIYATSSNFKIKRSQSETGDGEVLYQTSGTVKVKYKGDKSKYKAERYSYMSVYVNGRYIVLGEGDLKTKKVTYKRIRIRDKKQKKLASYVIPYYHCMSASNFSCSMIAGVYKNYIYYEEPRKKYDSTTKTTYYCSGAVYKKNMKTGKTVKIKALSNHGYNYRFDGRYIYLHGRKVYDFQTNRKKKIKMAVEVGKWQTGRDGKVYTWKRSDASNSASYTLYEVNHGEFELVGQFRLTAGSSLNPYYFMSYIGEITEKNIYCSTEELVNEEDDETITYYRYDRETKELIAITEAEYKAK